MNVFYRYFILQDSYQPRSQELFSCTGKVPWERGWTPVTRFLPIDRKLQTSGIIREYFYSVREVFKLWFLGSNFRLFPVNTGCCPFDIMAVGEFFFTPFILYIVPKYCHDEFFVSLNFLHGMFDSLLRSHSPDFMYLFRTVRRDSSFTFTMWTKCVLGLQRTKPRAEHKAWSGEFHFVIIALDRVLMFCVA